MNKPIKATINQSIDINKLTNGLLSVPTPINQKAVYTFEDIKIYDDIMDTVIFNSIHEKIARHCLNRLYSKGNMSAYEILTTGTAIIDFDDISNEVLVALYENKECLEVADGQFRIIGDEAIKAVYGACSRFMYSFMQKHYKHAYCEIDGQTVDIFNTRVLAQFADYNDIVAMDLYKAFMDTVKKTYPKDVKRIETLVKYRIDGLTYDECKEKMQCGKATVMRLQEKISTCAKALLKTL